MEFQHLRFQWALAARGQTAEQLAREICDRAWRRGANRRAAFLRWLGALSFAARSAARGVR
eukprot:6704298-Pyramimonas_sp.AAC.2